MLKPKGWKRFYLFKHYSNEKYIGAYLYINSQHRKGCQRYKNKKHNLRLYCFDCRGIDDTKPSVDKDGYVKIMRGHVYTIGNRIRRSGSDWYKYSKVKSDYWLIECELCFYRDRYHVSIIDYRPSIDELYNTYLDHLNRPKITTHKEFVEYLKQEFTKREQYYAKLELAERELEQSNGK